MYLKPSPSTTSIPNNNPVYSPIYANQPDPNPDPPSLNHQPTPYSNPAYPSQSAYSSQAVPNPANPYPQLYNQDYPPVFNYPQGNMVQPVIYPPPSYAQNSYMQPISYQQIAPLPQIVVPDMSSQHLGVSSFNEDSVIRFSRRAKCACIVNFIFDVVLVIANSGVLLIFLLNIIGFLSTIRFSNCLGITFLVYLGIIVVIKIILMAVFPSPVVIGVFLVTIVVNGVTFVVFVKFVRMLNGLDDGQIYNLRLQYQRQRCRGVCCYW